MTNNQAHGEMVRAGHISKLSRRGRHRKVKGTAVGSFQVGVETVDGVGRQRLGLGDGAGKSGKDIEECNGSNRVER